MTLPSYGFSSQKKPKLDYLAIVFLNEWKTTTGKEFIF